MSEIPMNNSTELTQISKSLIKQANSPQIYWVLGMHRSGTSFVSGLLHQSGIVMGTSQNFKPKPNKENPKGFFENYNFRLLNDKILENAGYIVKDWNPKLKSKKLKTSWIQRISMKRLIYTNNRKYNFWGWKDPRQMLTCFQWFDVLRNTQLSKNLKIILVYRNPISVSISMQKRKNIKTISHGFALWFLYNQRIISFIEESKIPCFTFSFERLVAEPSTLLTSLSQFIGIQIEPETYREFFSPKLIRSDFKNNEEININQVNDDMIVKLFEQLASLETHSLQGLTL